MMIMKDNDINIIMILKVFKLLNMYIFIIKIITDIFI